MKTMTIRVTLLFTAVALLAASPCLAEEELRTVPVSGTFVQHVVPDIVNWHINTVGTHKKNLSEAKKHSDDIVKMILSQIGDMDVESEDIQTSHLRVKKTYNKDKEGRKTTFKQYEIHRTINFKQKDLSRFDEFFDLLTSNNDITASHKFESSKFHELRWESRIEACKIARKKAEVMCEAAGAKLGRLLSISENPPSNNKGSIAYFNQIPGGSVANSASMWKPSKPDTISGTFAAGAIEIKVTAYAVFEIK